MAGYLCNALPRESWMWNENTVPVKWMKSLLVSVMLCTFLNGNGSQHYFTRERDVEREKDRMVYQNTYLKKM